jgi:hypothetical protein
MKRQTKRIDAGLRRILQIIPAIGWRANLESEGVEDPLVCWALIHEGGLRRRVVGVIQTRDKESGRLEFVDRVSDLAGYQYRPFSGGD